MIVFNIVAWPIVSTTRGFLARSKSFVEDTPIWPSVGASKQC